MSTLSTANITSKAANTPPVIKDLNGTEIGQFASAWVNFNGRNDPAIRDSFNVASVTDLAAGTYKITFTIAMANANHAIAGSAAETGNGGNNDAFFGAGRDPNYSDLHTTTFCTVTVSSASGSNTDRDMISAIIFGG